MGAMKYYKCVITLNPSMPEYGAMCISSVTSPTISLVETTSSGDYNINFPLYNDAYPVNGVQFVVGDYLNPIVVSQKINFSGALTSYAFGMSQDNWFYSSPNMFSDYQVKFGVRIWDSWGNSNVFYFEYVAYKYTLPQITLFDATRNATTETTAVLALETSIIPLYATAPIRNEQWYLFQYDNGGVWTDIGVETHFTGSTITGLTYEDTGPWNSATSYKFRVRLRDKFNTVYGYDTLSTTLVPLSIGKFGIGVGKIIENADAALDINGKFYRDNIAQPKIFKKKPSDPDPTDMVDGDILLIYNDTQAFSSSNFPQEFGTGYVWSQTGVWPNDYNYWTSTSSSSNTVVESIEGSSFKGSAYPSYLFDGNTNWDNNFMMPYGALPAVQIIKFKGSVQFNSFTIHGWAHGHEVKNSPKSFAFFGSNDAHTWISLYDTTAFPDSYNTSVSANMNNTGLYFKYLKLVWRTNQDNNSGNLTNASMIAMRELVFNASGVRYV